MRIREFFGYVLFYKTLNEKQLFPCLVSFIFDMGVQHDIGFQIYPQIIQHIMCDIQSTLKK